MGDTSLNASPSPRQRDPRFPPMVRFSVFLDTVTKFSGTSPERRTEILDALSDNDRSQLLRTLSLFGLRTEDGTYDELGLRRVADLDRRAGALRELLHTHFREQLEAIGSGVTRDTLEGTLAVPGRSSPSSVQKARQFLERAMEAADMPTDSIAVADRLGTAPRSSTTSSGRAGPVWTDQERRYVELQQRYLDQLLEQHARTSSHEKSRDLAERIDTVSQRLDTLMGLT